MAIQLKRSLSANINQNYVLAQGQVGISMTDSTNKYVNPYIFKIGDGTTTWQNLPYANTALSQGTYQWLTVFNTLNDDNRTFGDKTSTNVIYNYTGNSYIEIHQLTNGANKGNNWNINRYATDYSGVFICANGVLDNTVNKYTPAMINFRLYGNQYNQSGATMRFRTEDSKFTLEGGGWTLGNSAVEWQAVYALTGAIQTSARASKHHIRYISASDASMIDAESPTNMNPDLSTIINFINKIEPATFVYNTVQDDPIAAEDRPENIQLGLIADDIEDDPLFPYIGAKFDYTDEANPENDIHTLALKPLPLAIVACTLCKYLFNRVELLESKVLA